MQMCGQQQQRPPLKGAEERDAVEGGAVAERWLILTHFQNTGLLFDGEIKEAIQV